MSPRNARGQTVELDVMVEVTDIQYGGLVAIAHGRTADGDRVTFADSPRVLHAVHEMLEAGEPSVWTVVPAWAILAREPDPIAG